MRREFPEPTGYTPPERRVMNTRNEGTISVQHNDGKDTRSIIEIPYPSSPFLIAALTPKK